MNNNIIIISISLCITILIVAIFFIIPKSRRVLIKAFKEEFIVMSLSIIMCILLGLLVFTNISRIVLMDTKQEEKVNIIENEKEIVSLNLNQGISGAMNGSFILGIGSINGNVDTETYFYFYTKEDNKYKLEKINTEIALIEETDEVNPKIVYREYNNVVVVTQIPTKLGEKLGLNIEEFEYTNTKNNETILYIPSGSIVENYNPNLQ